MIRFHHFRFHRAFDVARAFVFVASFSLAIAPVSSALADARAEVFERSIPVLINLGSSGLESRRVEEAIERELGFLVHADAAAPRRIEVVVTGRRANVTYFNPGSEPLTRSVDLPRDPDRAVETIALLTGNLARDEASELLAELRARSPELVGNAATTPPGQPDSGSTPAPQSEPHAPQPKTASKAPSSARKKVDAPSGEALLHSPANLSLYYPTTILPHTEQRVLNFELGLAYSRVEAIEGAGLTLGYLRVNDVRGYTNAVFWNRSDRVDGLQTGEFVNEGHGPLRGFDYAGLASYRDGAIQGMQAAGLFSYGRSVEGAQVGGLVAIARGVQGLQAAGVANYVDGESQGIELAGAVNVATAPVMGFQVAGGANVGRDAVGVEFAGLGNLARGRVDGMQVGGGANLAADLRGVQIAGGANVARDFIGAQVGTVNVGRRVRGVQIGVVNVAQEIHGGALGLVNIAGNGRIQPAVWVAGPDTSINTGVKFITDYTYALVGVGYSPDQSHLRYEAGLGLHLEPVPRLSTDIGLHFSEVYDAHDVHEDAVRREFHYRATAGFEVLPWLTPFAGAGLVARVTGTGDDLSAEYFVGVAAL